MGGHMIAFDSQLLIGIAIQLFNTAVLAALLSWILYKPVKKFLHARKDRISQSLSEAERKLKDAYDTKSLYDEKFGGIESERKEILTASRVRAHEIEEQIINEAKMEAEAIKDRAIREMEMERKRYEEELRKQIIEISTIIAERYVEEKMDERTGARLLNEALDELGGSVWLD